MISSFSWVFAFEWHFSWKLEIIEHSFHHYLLFASSVYSVLGWYCIFTLLTVVLAEWVRPIDLRGLETYDHAFRGNLLYRWINSLYWTCRGSVTSCYFHTNYQLLVTQLYRFLIRWIPPTSFSGFFVINLAEQTV